MPFTRLLAETLARLRSLAPTGRALVGFDGYLDFIERAVQEQTASSRTYFGSMTEFGEHIALAAGKSAQVELAVQAVKLGGNGPIMAHALGSLGIPTTCLGTLGEGGIHPVFQQMHPNCELVSLGRPAATNALEFEDGKLMLSELSAFDHLDAAFLMKTPGEEFLTKKLADSQLIALVDWVNLPQATDLWRGVLELLKKNNLRGKQFLFDFCDPSKKSVDDIREVLGLLREFEDVGTVTLGLNENEAIQVYRAWQGLSDGETGLPLAVMAETLFAQIGISALLIHPTDRSLVVTKTGLQEVPGRLVKHPKLLTGGGDNLNAGYCLGLLAGCSPAQCALLGMATSGAYVQAGQSPDVTAVTAYLEHWQREWAG